jgi:hypothetical protein
LQALLVLRDGGTLSVLFTVASISRDVDFTSFLVRVDALRRTADGALSSLAVVGMFR